jgi:hypothetical protein
VKWVKRGLVYKPGGQFNWNKSHAQLPVVDSSEAARWRIYFATRDEHSRSSISYIEVESERPENILYEHDHPVLPFGELGSFDESGLMPLCVVNQPGKKYLYYAGWSLKKTVPYQNAIGLAVSTDEGKSFTKLAAGPLFDTRLHEPYFTGTADVLVDNGLWRVWYQSCTKWQLLQGKPEPFYHLKYAESADGINWERKGVVAIDYRDETEGGISRASVIKSDGIYRMWYSYRGSEDYRSNKQKSYRIGYAESLNGIQWTRRDEQAGIDVSDAGWDSEMIAYPCVIRGKTCDYLFYNGNGFGQQGFGYAVSAEIPHS